MKTTVIPHASIRFSQANPYELNFLGDFINHCLCRKAKSMAIERSTDGLIGPIQVQDAVMISQFPIPSSCFFTGFPSQFEIAYVEPNVAFMLVMKMLKRQIKCLMHKRHSPTNHQPWERNTHAQKYCIIFSLESQCQ